jgi:serine/threonine-protein phosphatase 2A regulatory subunit B
LTGSYSNFFHIYDIPTKGETVLQADKSAFKAKKPSKAKSLLGGSKKTLTKKEEFMNADALDYTRKILHASWHPRENTVALAATNNLYLFSQV